MSLETTERPRAARAKRSTDTPTETSLAAAVTAPHDVTDSGAVAPSVSEVEGRQSDAFGTLGPTPITDETRRPLGRIRPKLDMAPIDGFHCRWINDTDKGRVRDALEAGYQFIKGDDGKPVQRVVGVKKGGGPLIAYRMKIPLHWWLKDQVDKSARRSERRNDMINGMTERGAPGSDGRYLPMRGNAPINAIQNEDLGKGK